LWRARVCRRRRHTRRRRSTSRCDHGRRTTRRREPGRDEPLYRRRGDDRGRRAGHVPITSLADGRLQLAGHSTVGVAFVPDDPDGVAYTGHETFNFAASGEGHTFTTTLTTHVRVRGTDGSFITVREVAHLTVAREDVVVAFDRPMLVCSGIA
jgi:hypothetical protein